MKQKIIGGKIICDDEIIENGTLLINGGKIEDVLHSSIEAPDYKVIDVNGCYVSPGFIDIHTHGGGGYDFMDATKEAYLGAAVFYAEHGVTSVMPTTLASSFEELTNTLDVYKNADAENIKGAQFIGFHLEGPYFAPAQAGADRKSVV